jgi:hypothetical protein
MCKPFRIAAGFTFYLISVGMAAAQTGGYTIQTPGRPPTNVNPLGNDRYIIQTPGQPPTNVSPLGNDRYIVQTPGQPATVINPNR